MISCSSEVNQPLREKLQQWRAQKATEVKRVKAAGDSHPTPANAPAAAKVGTSGEWYRSVPTARRTNLILKSTDHTKACGKSGSGQKRKEHTKDLKENIRTIENCAHRKGLDLPIQEKNITFMNAKELVEYKQKVQVLTEKTQELVQKLERAETVIKEVTLRGKLAMEEVVSVQCLNDILEQKNLELDCQLSKERMLMNESSSEKARKHKQDMEKMRAEKADYEKRADDLVSQLNEQMTQLQTCAMDRIAV